MSNELKINSAMLHMFFERVKVDIKIQKIIKALL